MRRFLKYLFIAVITITLAVTAFVVYELKFKQYDIADKAIKDLVNETFTIDLPDGEQLILDSEGNVVEKVSTTDFVPKQFTIDEDDIIIEVTAGKVIGVYNGQHEVVEHATIKVGQAVVEKDNQTTVVIDNKQQEVTLIPSTTTGPTQKEKPTVVSIKSKYTGSFATLEQQAKGKLNELVSQAKSEYSAKRSNGESISYSYFYKKYYGAATALEASIDANFETLLSVVKNELEQNGFNKSYADSFRTEYTAMKKELRSELLSKVSGF